jgi:hypothetical protein
MQLTQVAASGVEPDLIADENGHLPARSSVPQVQAGMSRLIKLDSQLHQTLDTVLAEAMARMYSRDTSPGSNG